MLLALGLPERPARRSSLRQFSKLGPSFIGTFVTGLVFKHFIRQMDALCPPQFNYHVEFLVCPQLFCGQRFYHWIVPVSLPRKLQLWKLEISCSKTA